MIGAFPKTPELGTLFYHTDLDGWCVCTGNGWVGPMIQDEAERVRERIISPSPALQERIRQLAERHAVRAVDIVVEDGPNRAQDVEDLNAWYYEQQAALYREAE
jgi:hypothetical protein